MVQCEALEVIRSGQGAPCKEGVNARPPPFFPETVALAWQKGPEV